MVGGFSFFSLQVEVEGELIRELVAYCFPDVGEIGNAK